MKVLLTNSEKLEIFHNALCNGLGYFINGYGFVLSYIPKEYAEAKAKLKSPCIEDILMQILKDGGTLQFIDDENDGQDSVNLTLQMVLDNIETTPADNLVNIKNMTDDAVDADCVIQSVLYREVQFG